MGCYENEFSFTPASAYSANVNILPTLRSTVESYFSGAGWDRNEAALYAVDLRADTAFTVRLNRNTEVKAVSLGTTFVVQYSGLIEYIVFDRQVSMTSVWMTWGVQHKDHNTPTIAAPSGYTATVTTLDGQEIYKDASGKYELKMGEYLMNVGGSSYPFFYNLEDSLTAVVVDNAGETE